MEGKGVYRKGEDYLRGKVMVKEIRTGMVPFHRKEGICAKLKILE